jgi:hypothetical protein
MVLVVVVVAMVAKILLTRNQIISAARQPAKILMLLLKDLFYIKVIIG